MVARFKKINCKKVKLIGAIPVHPKAIILINTNFPITVYTMVLSLRHEYPNYQYLK